MDIKNLFERNYVPYSNQPSVCVVRSIDNHYFPGSRIENASFPLTISALQAAIFCCLSEGEKPKAVYTDDENRDNLHYWKSEFKFWVYPLKQLEENISFAPVSRKVDREEIPEHLENLLQNAVVPNSNFPVSALLETEEGVIAGVNIECDEWNYGLCAERVAIAKALSYGYTNFKKLHIHTRKGEFSSPCGACRQVIVEHFPDNPLYLHHADKTISTHTTKDLLPFGFYSTELRA